MESVQPKNNWFGRNWKWFVPVSGLGILLCCAAVTGAALVYILFSAVKTSEPYRMALEKVRASSAAQEVLGTPIRDGVFANGSIEITGNSGTAELSIPVSGPKGSGTVNLTAQENNGRWSFLLLELVMNGSGRRINLLIGQ
jgi:hypothetical protein